MLLPRSSPATKRSDARKRAVGAVGVMGAGGIGAPFARLIANLIVTGTGVVGRAFVEAYKQALQNGTANRAASSAGSASKAFEAEARLILNVKQNTPKEEMLEAAEKMAAMNHPDKGGSKYLQAKINFARDVLIAPEQKQGPLMEANPSHGASSDDPKK